MIFFTINWLNAQKEGYQLVLEQLLEFTLDYMINTGKKKKDYVNKLKFYGFWYWMNTFSKDLSWFLRCLKVFTSGHARLHVWFLFFPTDEHESQKSF